MALDLGLDLSLTGLLLTSGAGVAPPTDRLAIVDRGDDVVAGAGGGAALVGALAIVESGADTVAATGDADLSLKVTVFGDGTFTVEGAADASDFTLTGGAQPGTYTVDVGADASDVLAILGAPSGTESGGTWTLEPAPVLASASKGAVALKMQVYRLIDGTLLQEGPMAYDEVGGEASTGLGVRQIAYSQASASPVQAEADLIPLASYAEQGIVYDGATVVVSQENLAANATEAQSFLVFISYEAAAGQGGVGRLLDVNLDGVKLNRTATDEGSLTISDNAGGSVTVGSGIAAGAGRFNFVAAGTWNASTGLSARLVGQKDGGAPIVSDEITMPPGAATALKLEGVVGIMGRSSGASTQIASGTVFRAGAWVGIGAVDLTDSAVFGQLFAPDGTCQAPSLSEGAFGQGKLDQRGTTVGVLTGKHDGSQGDLAIARGALSLASDLGPEKVANGAFDTDLASWTAAGAWAQSAGAAVNTGSVGFDALQQALAGLDAGKTYRVSFDITAIAGTLEARFGAYTGAGSIGTWTAPQAVSVDTAPQAGTTGLSLVMYTGGTCTIDKVSVREVI